MAETYKQRCTIGTFIRANSSTQNQVCSQAVTIGRSCLQFKNTTRQCQHNYQKTNQGTYQPARSPGC